MKRLTSLVLTLAMSASMLNAFAVAEGLRYTTETTADGWVKVINEGGTTLGYSADSGVTLLEVDGYAFKDLNKNGSLDDYEDWRKTADERAIDLVNQLTEKDILPLMMVDMQIELGGRANSAEFTDEQKALVDQGILEQYGGSTANIKNSVEWFNTAQAFAESRAFGMPIQFVSDPFTNNAANAPHFPTNLAIAATFDTDVAKDMGMYTSRVYRAVGITTLLGPQIDVASEPRWRRVGSTFGEDPALAADMAKAMTDGIQSTFDAEGNDLGWGTDSVNAMLKHWPGDGAAQSGREAHQSTGTYNVYPGDNFEAHLIPFVDGGLSLDGLTVSATAIMPSYSIAFSEDEEYGDLVGSGFSEYKLNILRENGFDGVICTDWEIVSDADNNGKPWGAEELTEAERTKLALMAGCDQIGALHDVNTLFEAYQLMIKEMGEADALARIRESGRRILRNKFLVGSFDNPYLSLAESTAILADEAANAAAADAQVKSIVMVKNNDVITEKTDNQKPTVYVPLVFTGASTRRGVTTPASISLPIENKVLKKYFNVVTDSISTTKTGEPDANGNPMYSANDIIRATADQLEKCDYAIVFANMPVSSTVYDKESDSYLPISLQYNEYTANSMSVRTESLAGPMIDVEIETPYGTQKSKKMKNLSYFGNTASYSNKDSLDMILNTAAMLPESAKLIVCENGNSSMVFSEFEEVADAILVGFGVDNTAFLEIIAGNAEPNGLLPMQMPVDMDTVEEQYEDVPRDMECYVDSNGNTYDFAFGLNWSGVIQDERVARYSVPALTAPQSEGFILP